MADSLYLSLWFPSFEEAEILPRMVSVLQQFPFSPIGSGVTYVALQPVSWNEPTILERRFLPGVPPEEAAGVASEFVHDDFAYVFEADWDLWSLTEDGTTWKQDPAQVRFIAQGVEFDEGTSAQTGHILVDFGLDVPFVHEELSLTPDAEQHVRNNVQRLIAFTALVEKNAGVTGRLLWSESEENLAQKLIARLQKTH